MNKPQDIATVRKILTDYLKAHKMRKTPERYAILDAIYKIDGHFEIDDLYRKMKDEKYPISKATLYNNIALLLDANLLIQHHIKDNATQYERTCSTTHNHIICTMCGRIIEMTDKNLSKTIEAEKIPGFRISHYSLYVYGLCAKCARKMDKQTGTSRGHEHQE